MLNVLKRFRGRWGFSIGSVIWMAKVSRQDAKTQGVFSMASKFTFDICLLAFDLKSGFGVFQNR